MDDLKKQTPALIKGLGVIVGEIALGVNGPFFFEHFGLSVPVAVATAAVMGGVIGYGVVAIGFWFRHRRYRHVTKPASDYSPGLQRTCK